MLASFLLKDTSVSHGLGFKQKGPAARQSVAWLPGLGPAGPGAMTLALAGHGFPSMLDGLLGFIPSPAARWIAAGPVFVRIGFYVVP